MIPAFGQILEADQVYRELLRVFGCIRIGGFE